jgi:two-component system, LytTR family, sensor kinase
MNRPPLRSRLRATAVVVVLFLVEGLLLFEYKHLDHVARHAAVPWLEPFVEEATGVLTALLLLPVLLRFVRRFPLGRATWWRYAPLHLAFMAATSVAHTWMMGVTRGWVFPALGLGAYDYGDMRVRYWMEGANDATTYAIVVMIVMGYDAMQAARARELREAELRAELARAQIKSLEQRLHPHFLFNALNTISSIMYDDPKTADRMIAGLSALLRRALRTGEAQEVPLSEELAMLGDYLDIMRARFEDKLDVALRVDDDAKQAMVPPLLLQPIVENAIHHGADPASHRVRAALHVRRRGDALEVEVRDHGRGIGGAAPKEGVGLATTARRLSTLYGAAQRLDLEDAEGGGLRVTIALPFRTAALEPS